MFNSFNNALFFKALGILIPVSNQEGTGNVRNVMHFENGVKWRNTVSLIMVRVREIFSNIESV